MTDDVEPNAADAFPALTREASYASGPDPAVTDGVEPHAPEALSTVDDGATLVPTDSAESKAAKPKVTGFDRFKELVHIRSSSPAPVVVREDAAKEHVDVQADANLVEVVVISEPVVTEDNTAADNTTASHDILEVPTATTDEPVAKGEKPKLSPLKRLKSLVHKGGNKGPKSPVDVVAPISVVEDDVLEVPSSPVRSITPSQLGELVDISMASEASLDVPPNTPPSPAILPSIEAVLASSPTSRSPTPSLTLESSPASSISTSDNVDAVAPPAKEPIDESTPVPDPHPSLETLANDIRFLIGKIPRPPIESSTPRCPEPSAPKRDGEGKPIPPSAEAGRGFALPTSLARYLKDRNVMTGESQVSQEDTVTDADVTSVWSILDTLKAPWANDDDDDVGRKIMLYIPLDIGDNSKVEVAQAVEVEVSVSDVTDGKKATRYFGGDYLPQAIWPFEGWWGSKKKPVETEVPKVETPADTGKKPSKKVYLPSPDKLSVEVAWWGYRL